MPSTGTTSSSPSASPSTTTPSPTATEPAYVPAKVLVAALVPATMYKKGTVSWEEIWGPEDGWGAGESLGIEVVSGDPSCTQMSEGHPVGIATGAVREIQWPDLFLQSYAQSMPTVADAVTVMDQNVSQVVNCTTLKVRFNAKTYAAKHRLVSKIENKGQVLGVMHALNVDFGDGRSMTVLMQEIRRGGELMFVVLIPLTTTGNSRVANVMGSAQSQFKRTIDAYRATHPRPVEVPTS